jgi:hypothetical protein
LLWYSLYALELWGLFQDDESHFLPNRSACLSSGNFGASRVAVRRRHAALPSYLDTIRIYPVSNYLLRIPYKRLRCFYFFCLLLVPVKLFSKFCFHNFKASTDIFIMNYTIINILRQLFHINMPGLRSRGPGLRSRGPGLRSRGPGLRSKLPGLRSRGPGLRSRLPGLRSRGPDQITRLILYKFTVLFF